MQKIQSSDWLHFKFKFSNSKQTFVCRFLLQKVFLKLISIFVFFVFILVDTRFWFHKDREITKNLFTLAENNFGERKLLCTRIIKCYHKECRVQYFPWGISPHRISNFKSAVCGWIRMTHLRMHLPALNLESFSIKMQRSVGEKESHVTLAVI